MYQFLVSDDGAVTVDWVVLTAALVGLGLALMLVISGGVEDLSQDVSDELESNIIRTTFGSTARIEQTTYVQSSNIGINSIEQCADFLAFTDGTDCGADVRVLIYEVDLDDGSTVYMHRTASWDGVDLSNPLTEPAETWSTNFYGYLSSNEADLIDVPSNVDEATIADPHGWMS